MGGFECGPLAVGEVGEDATVRLLVATDSLDGDRDDVFDVRVGGLERRRLADDGHADGLPGERKRRIEDERVRFRDGEWTSTRPSVRSSDDAASSHDPSVTSSEASRNDDSYEGFVNGTDRTLNRP